ADIGGLRDWAKAVVLMGCAAGLASLRGIVPDALAIVLASALMLLGQLLLVTGLLRYIGRTPQWRPALDAVLGLVLLIAWLTWGSPSYPGRIFIMSLAHVAFFALGAWLARQAQPAGLGRGLLVATFALGAAIAVLRIATLTTDFAGADEAFDRDPIQQIYLAAFSLGILGLSIGFILIASERLREALEYLATRDPMTGALNRRAFFIRAELEWARAARTQRPLAAIAADIDFFKKVNDTWGHQVGDRVIVDFARRAGGMLRPSDILSRFGGEEFIILLPETGLADACRVAERIRQEIEGGERSKPGKGGKQRRERRHGQPSGETLPPFTVSLGVAVAGGSGPADLESLLAAADAALYRAKQGGRNRVES
ncbi:MAG: GGDEF domain-containing protein, partial [Azospira sp.]|nr:GGDEF domain-containing protein [Azospira sp.]